MRSIQPLHLTAAASLVSGTHSSPARPRLLSGVDYDAVGESSQFTSFSFLGSSHADRVVRGRSPGFTRLFAVTGHAPAAGITYDPGCRIRYGQRRVTADRHSARHKLRGRPGGSSDLIPHSNPSLVDSVWFGQAAAGSGVGRHGWPVRRIAQHRTSSFRASATTAFFFDSPLRLQPQPGRPRPGVVPQAAPGALDQRRAQQPRPAAGDPAAAVGLPALVLPRHQPGVGADLVGRAEPRGRRTGGRRSPRRCGCRRPGTVSSSDTRPSLAASASSVASTARVWVVEEAEALEQQVQSPRHSSSGPQSASGRASWPMPARPSCGPGLRPGGAGSPWRTSRPRMRFWPRTRSETSRLRRPISDFHWRTARGRDRDARRARRRRPAGPASGRRRGRSSA